MPFASCARAGGRGYACALIFETLHALPGHGRREFSDTIKRGRVRSQNASESGQGACISRQGRARGTNASESEGIILDAGAENAPGDAKTAIMSA